MGIVLNLAGVTLQDILQAKTAYIKAISNFLTNDFMKDSDVLDSSSVVSDGSILSIASDSTTSSSGSESFCGFDENNLESDALRFFLSGASLEGSVMGDETFSARTQNDSLDDAPDIPGLGGGNKPRLATVATTKRNRKYKSRSSPKRKSKSNNKSKSRHKRNSKLTNKTFCRKRKSYLSRKPHKKQTLKKA
jgi:hypothetical protein